MGWDGMEYGREEWIAIEKNPPEKPETISLKELRGGCVK